MSNFVTKNNKKSFVATAEHFLVGAAGKHALALADKYAGKVDQVEIDGKPRYKFTFGEMDNRDKFVKAFDRAYSKATAPAGISKTVDKPKKKAAPAGKGTGKGDWKKAVDKFKGKGKKFNHEVAGVLRAHGITPNGAEWDYWKSIR